MSTPTYTEELSVALKAVRLASLLTKSHLLTYLSKQSVVSEETKSDASEVTVADFAAQAVIIAAIHAAFPDDNFIAEESGEMLREDQGLSERVWDLVEKAMEIAARTDEGDGAAVDELRRGDVTMSLPGSPADMVDIIDKGQKGGQAERSRSGRTWILDPIDGTKTYIRGHQYAVCLCLVDEGEQKVAVLGCPNLDLQRMNLAEEDVKDGTIVIGETVVDPAPDGGWILSAVKGEGTHISAVRTYETRLSIQDFLSHKEVMEEDLEEQAHRVMSNMSQTSENGSTLLNLNFTDSSASPHISKDIHERIFRHFAHPPQPESHSEAAPFQDIWSMQMKYVLLALRAADAMIRTPPTSSYHAAVWDHAGGQLLLTESGGVLTDANGKSFVINGQTRRLEHNWGVCGVRGGDIVADGGRRSSPRDVHKAIMARIRIEVSARRQRRSEKGEDD
ncbi:hypothetical protein LTR64_007910 [Lithohypha guttulata]|uniref:uncharacterized protein n=1 Tax=Lithohypha guttulata TaxID=1690604 RepID=UPI002DE0415D|nr:hypothetical protein LTR51_008222 [Lithohypha guttulata]